MKGLFLKLEVEYFFYYALYSLSDTQPELDQPLWLNPRRGPLNTISTFIVSLKFICRGKVTPFLKFFEGGH